MRARRAAGFTLVELAVVMAIVALLLGGLMFTLSAQKDQRDFEETRRRIEQARELLLAYSITNGRLPCPATATSAGDEQPIGGATTCTTSNGWLPAKTLGYQQTDDNGYALDAWGGRIRYAVATLTPTNCSSTNTVPHFTNSTNLKANGISCQPSNSDLIVCKSSTGIGVSDCGTAANQVMARNLVVAVILSNGKNGGSGSAGADEAANTDTDRVFVWHTPAPDFDDQMTWITVGELYGKLISAGVLP